MSVLVFLGYVVALAEPEAWEGQQMWSIAPASVMFLALVGVLIVAFAATRMALLERRLRRTTLSVPQQRQFVKSNA